MFYGKLHQETPFTLAAPSGKWREVDRPQAQPLPRGYTVDANELVTVYTVSNPVEAEIIKNALLDEGIRCFVGGENQTAESGLTGIAVSIEVPASEAERAREFIRAHDRRHRLEQEAE